MSHVMNTYARLPVAFTHGQGVWLWDAQGKRYLDGLAGIAVNTLGHAHPRLVQALPRTGGNADPLLQYLSDHRAGKSGRQARCDQPAWTRSSSAIPAARPTRRRSSWRGCTATGQGHREPRHRGDGEGLPRPHAGDAVGHRQPQGAGRIRAAGVGLRARAVTTIWKRCAMWRRTTATWSRSWSSRSRAKAASMSRTSSTCAACANSATSTTGC